MVPHNNSNDRSFDMLYDMVLEIKEDVAELKGAMSERTGERRVISWLSTAVSALMGTVAGAGIEFFRHRAS